MTEFQLIGNPSILILSMAFFFILAGLRYTYRGLWYRYLDQYPTSNPVLDRAIKAVPLQRPAAKAMLSYTAALVLVGIYYSLK